MENILVEHLHDSPYFALLTTLSSNDPIDLIRNFELNSEFSCSGKILIDNILHSGNNSDRFIEISCEEGKINYKSMNNVAIERKNHLRIKANETLRKYPSIINNSILNNSQKKLLLHGISI
ncbi:MULTISPECIES: type II toxin-antitoxin system RnlB family antitoxin [Priestia]|uniref:type II toxin-antitoxin system RnlB family antitoxin n=1 Tax=Priestia TaxID=2800373 RepID=UPI0012FD7D1A|nr:MULTISPECIES: type II toxin-antitoxin system RnlB family antitoxin [Priestia]MED3821647.1 type II toxin-antitoxin system RnlB family antitoxin [Priestia aryabhattai]UPK52908.1 type II toxin-antitoxin system RnlB family antitoxin [Bacillus sp. H8-1]